MATLTIQIDDKWKQRIRSPLYKVVSSMQGVALSFAPIFIYMIAKGIILKEVEWLVVPICFMIILVVGVFNLKLAQATVNGIKNAEDRT